MIRKIINLWANKRYKQLLNKVSIETDLERKNKALIRAAKFGDKHAIKP